MLVSKLMNKMGHNAMKITSIYLHLADSSSIKMPDLL